MATPLVTLITNAGPYVRPAITPTQQLAIEIYGKLAFCGAAPYNYNNSGSAINTADVQNAVADMRTNVGALSLEQLSAATAFMWPRSATGSFAGVKTSRDLQLASQAVTYLQELDMDTLRRLNVWAEYAYNVIVNGLP